VTSQPTDPPPSDPSLTDPSLSDPSLTDPRTRSKGPIVAVLLGGLVVILGALYAIGYALADDTVPKNATVEGVAIGGLAPEEAAATLERELAPQATAQLQLELAGDPAVLDPVAAGLSVDYPASVQAAGGERSLDPRHFYRVLTGGTATAAVIDVDEAKLSAAVDAIARAHDRQPADAQLSYAGRTIVAKDGVQGITLDQAGAIDAITQGYPAEGPITIPAATADPEITTAEMRALVRDFARPAVAAPVVVETGGAGSFEISPTMIASAITFPAADGALSPSLDAAKLRRAADSRIGELDLADHRDATVRLVDGKPKVIASTDGTDISATDLASAVRPVLGRPKRERTVTAKLSGAPARFTTADARKLGITEVTGRYTTYFPYATYRNVNIGRAAAKINNTVLKPGETFSLNKVVGERTKANGFVEGYIIKGGKFSKELGGGVSQSATTTFNAMFFAGLQDIRHQPHTLYIDRYPAGREATVAWPGLDLKFKNDTDYGVLVQAYVKKATPTRKGSITVKMWSTKTWDRVSSSSLVRSGYTSGRDLTDDSADCEPQAPVPGFTVNYSRLFHRDGKVVKRERFRWRYAPTDRIRCT
jgi:vancomycin resistance protein YoaR